MSIGPRRITKDMELGKEKSPSLKKDIGGKGDKQESLKIDLNIVVPKYSLSDLIVPAHTATSIRDFLAHKKYESLIYDEWGLNETHQHQKQIAINLYGPPGTGKTMAAYGIAKELNQPLIMIDYASLESKYVGETSKNIVAIFQQAKEQKAIIFFDEADAMLSRRVTGMSHATDVSVNQTRSVLLTEMNNHEGLIIFTTNFIENYDPAFMRRILAHIYFDLPDLECRLKLWQQYIPTKLPHNADLKELAEISETLTGSDISNSVRKAAMAAARRGAKEVDVEDFLKAIEEIKKSKAANKNQSHHKKQNRKQSESKDSELKSTESTRVVSEEYVVSQLGTEKTEELKA